MIIHLFEHTISLIDQAGNFQELEAIRIKLLGKNGEISTHMQKLSSLSGEERKSFGQEINRVKGDIESKIRLKQIELKEQEIQRKIINEKIDVTLPGVEQRKGSIHPITQAKDELIEIFGHLGFTVEEGPSIENDWYNFTALNIAENHPARQMHDTFYLPDDNDGNKLVLRTHTSPVQIRVLEKSTPPLRFIAPGRTYRSDYDQTHSPMFHQIEGLVVDKDINMGHLKHTIITLIQTFFENSDLLIRFRPSFFPFTEPSAEVDIKFKGDDNAKWLEVLGCGMIHPKVLANCGIDSNIYQGFALGLGIERMAMLKYGIDDLRQFYEGDARWTQHYSFAHFDVPSIIGGLTR